MQFRKKALSKLQALDEFDTPVQLTRPQHWLVIGTMAALVLGAGVWAGVGTIPRKLDAPGILTHLAGSFVLQSPVAGQITNVFVNQGGSFPIGTPLLSMQVGSRTQVIRSTTAGRVTALLAKVGQVIGMGAELAVIERIDDKDDRLVAVLYVPSASSATIRNGSSVDLSVSSAPTKDFGVLRGKVVSVGKFAETTVQITDFLGDATLGAQFTAVGQPIKVVVDLSVAKDTASGYEWSTKAGPPYRIDSRAMVTGSIHLRSMKPIEWVVK